MKVKPDGNKKDDNSHTDKDAVKKTTKHACKKLKVVYNPKSRHETEKCNTKVQDDDDIDGSMENKSVLKHKKQRTKDVDTVETAIDKEVKGNKPKKQEISRRKVTINEDFKTTNTAAVRKSGSRKSGHTNIVVYNNDDESKDVYGEGKKKKNVTKKRKKPDGTRKAEIKNNAKNNADWFSLRTRASPHQLSLAVKKMTKKQRDAIKSIGFGKILTIQVDGIPSKLGHFVVDRFDPENMVIDLGNVNINIDNDTIHQLLGIPNSGIELESFEYKKNFVGIAKQWKDMYPGSYVAPSEVAAMIERNGDDDGIMFKINFLMLFMSSIVEVQDQGKCDLNFIHHVRDGIDLGDINWCSYIITSMKKCKNGWRRGDKKSYFTGALTILTLLYVDRVNVPPLNVDRQISPIRFWTLDKLRSREKIEMDGGGFGMGELRDMYLDVNEDEVGNERKDKVTHNQHGSGYDGSDIKLLDDMPKPNDLTGHVSKLDALFECIARNKKNVEMALCDAYSAFPDISEIKTFVDKYDSIYKGALDIKVHATQYGWTQFFDENIDDIVAKTDNMGNIQESGKGDISAPTFNLGISSQESDAETKKMSDNIKKGVDNDKHDGEGTHQLYDHHPVNISEQMNDEEKLVWTYLMTVAQDKKEADQKRVVTGKNVSDGQDKELTEKEKKAAEIEAEKDEVERLFTKEIFATSYGLETKAFLLISLVPGKQLYTDTIDCWAAVLNYQERHKGPDSPRRLFCYTSTICNWMLTKMVTTDQRVDKFQKNLLIVLEGQNDKMDLNSYDVVVFPVLEKKHFYLVCFDLRKPSLEVVDNMHKKTSWVSIKDNSRFASKSITYKIKHILCVYMHRVQHPMANKMPFVSASKKELEWATKENFTDCGVFAMRHMEMYKGKDEPFECSFNSEESDQRAQISNLRMKYGARILLSEANVFKQAVLNDARSEMDKMKSKSSLS